MDGENSMRASRIKPPNPIGSPGKGLSELNESENNARIAKPSMLPAPQVKTDTLKHRLASAPEPEPKMRKTIMESATETYRSIAATPFPESKPERETLADRAGKPLRSVGATPARPPVKGISLQATGMRPPPAVSSRNTSNSSTFSASARSTSHSRSTSNSSYASSVGLGGRKASATSLNRPQTSFGYNKSQNGRPNPHFSRPATSLTFNHDEEEEEDEQPQRPGKRKAWDTETRLHDMESKFDELKRKLEATEGNDNRLEEAVTLYKSRIAELEAMRTQLNSANVTLQVELESTKQRLSMTSTTLEDQRRADRLEMDDLKREHRNEIEDLRRKLMDDTDRLIRNHRDELRELERRKDDEQEVERNALQKELQQLRAQVAEGNENTEVEKQKKDHEITRLRGELENLQELLEREKTQNKNLHSEIAESMTTRTKLEAQVKSHRAQIDFLESDSMSQSQRFEDMEARLQAALQSEKEAKEKLMKEESIRRSLFNQVQELKGNIRVMCRVRPTFGAEGPEDSAAISFPDSNKESKELEVLGPAEKSSLGKETRKLNAFSFDRVFGQSCKNEEIFEEISQLVQSALDGYNVCIFCYGQTGAGKTFTMSSADGMIPRAVKQIYETATKLKEKNWEYKMEGSFIEVYNEDLHDLLGNPKEFDKKKHEIRHDTQRKQTTVTDLTSVELDSPDKVETILSKAMSNRSVAATFSNERSSRSHSVFILKLLGHNTATGEMSEGTLNLVDLAGSERLKQSGAEGARMKETQNINKSLSCLGDVIGALGNGKEGSHIPYRNSKLTYLLQYSLGGNSKTLMFVMISPLQAHLNETLTSLKFATKVHNTHIGTAKKSTKIRERSSDA